MARLSLPKPADFSRVFAEGHARSNATMVLYWAPRPEIGDNRRLGLVVSAKVGSAVTRTRLKRVLREAFALVAADWPASYDYVIIARAALKESDRAGGMPAVAAQLRALKPRL